MAHLAHYKRSGAAPMLAHYERRAELERGYSRENIDASRTAENYVIGAGSPQALAAALRSRVDEAIAAHEADSGKAIRKDANVISDWVVTLPKDCPRGDARKFFETAVDVCRARYGAENVLGGFVHMDEATPHVHIPVVPVKDGRIRAAKVFTRSDLQRFHKDLGRAEDAALGRHVSVELDPAQQGEKQLSRLGQAEYVAAREEAARAAERAAGADKAAQAAERAQKAAERAQKAAEDRKRASEAAAEASERARAQASDAATAAKEDMRRQRDFAKRLGTQGKGIDWRYPDGRIEHESSVGEVRAERDAAKAEAAAAMKKKDDLLAFADEIRGERYEIDGRTYKGISAMADELKGLRAERDAAENELVAAQDKAAAARRAAADARAELAEVDGELAQKAEERDGIQVQIDQTRQQQGREAAKLQGLRDEVAEKRGLAADLSAQIEKKTAEKVEIQAQISYFSEKAGAAAQRLESVQGELGEVESIAQAGLPELAKRAASAGDGERESAARSQNQALRARLAALEEEGDGLAGRVRKLEGEKRGLEDESRGLRGRLEGLERRLDDLWARLVDAAETVKDFVFEQVGCLKWVFDDLGLTAYEGMAPLADRGYDLALESRDMQAASEELEREGWHEEPPRSRGFSR